MSQLWALLLSSCTSHTLAHVCLEHATPRPTTRGLSWPLPSPLPVIHTTLAASSRTYLRGGEASVVGAYLEGTRVQPLTQKNNFFLVCSG